VSHLIRRVLCRAGRVLRPLGCEVVGSDLARPCVWGSLPILGSYPSYSQHSATGSAENYFVHNGYQHREKAAYFDDTLNREESQVEVYRFAREICEREHLRTVVDIGCGSGFKLVKYLGHLCTVGVDVPATCKFLRDKYPNHEWKEFDPTLKFRFPVDLVIASDVIEHLERPNELMELIGSFSPRWILLSTPDRNLLRYGTHDGPPLNPAHIREWSFLEFQAYVKHYFDLSEHFIACAPQATQAALARPYGTS
jgi:SAM-dependent methyltransferase